MTGSQNQETQTNPQRLTGKTQADIHRNDTLIQHMCAETKGGKADKGRK